MVAPKTVQHNGLGEGVYKDLMVNSPCHGNRGIDTEYRKVVLNSPQ